jgi:hypothetical protein
LILEAGPLKNRFSPASVDFSDGYPAAEKMED